MKIKIIVAIMAVLALAAAPLWVMNANAVMEAISVDAMEPISVDAMEPISVDVMEPISVDSYGIIIVTVGDVEIYITPECDLSGAMLILFFDDDGFLVGWSVEDNIPTTQQNRCGARNQAGGYGEMNIDRSSEIHGIGGFETSNHAIVVIFGEEGAPIAWTYIDCFPTDYTIADIIALNQSIIQNIR